uniref:Uncharacterized protein n=1 Tax=Bionectria ochroleuca TaxID=29856 RepID=A0A8H7KBS5_BIOOC
MVEQSSQASCLPTYCLHSSSPTNPSSLISCFNPLSTVPRLKLAAHGGVFLHYSFSKRGFLRHTSELYQPVKTNDIAIKARGPVYLSTGLTWFLNCLFQYLQNSEWDHLVVFSFSLLLLLLGRHG